MQNSSFVPYLIVVVGPTASGKSRLAMTIAAQGILPKPVVILNADSRQVYKEFDIGTAKPSVADRQRVPHRFVDICEPTEVLTVAEYQQQAQAAIAQIHQSQDCIPLLAGGTGLYINAITKGLKIPRVPPNAHLRRQLTSLGQRHCYCLLKQVDPEATARIHPNDQVRTLRALEVYYVTGRTISSQQGEDPPSYPILYIGLDCDVDVLRSRITQRVHHMVEAGLVTEVQGLIEKYGADLPLLKTLGYAEMQQHLSGDLSLDAAIDLTVQHTCQFAKRQRTWFRKEAQIEWFTVGDLALVENVLARVDEFVQTLG
ncbi:MAG: tRNA (adenosine(37)-N6)-dimethylallyltransferase MiaA [Cyanobacteria bacterium J06597_16]